MTREEFEDTLNMLVELDQSNYKTLNVREEYEYLLCWGTESYRIKTRDFAKKQLRKRKIQQLNELES